MPRLPYTPSSYGQGRSGAFESQRLINLYPEVAAGPGGKNIVSLVGTPGRRIWYTSNSPPVRGGVGFNGLLYVVISNKFLSIASDGVTVSVLGTLQTSTGRVSVKNNGLAAAGVGGNQICIADGTARYIYDTGTAAFTTYTDIGAPVQVEFIDGYFVFINGTMSSYTSEIYDGATVNALTQNPVEAATDIIQAVLNLHQQLFFIKQYTSEVYYNTGTPTSQGSPFSRVQGAVIDYGTPAPWSVARGDNSAFFLATQRRDQDGGFVGVVELNGYVPTVITPQSITYRMSKSTDLSQCFGFCYYNEGHTFYRLTNPVDDWTWEYDATTQMWHECSTSNLVDDAVHRDMSNCYLNAFGMHLVGDVYTGNIYEMSSEFNTDAGLPIVSEQTTQHLFDEEYLEDIFIGELQCDFEAGVGVTDVNRPALAYAEVTGGVVSSLVLGYNGADYTTQPTVLIQSTDGYGTGATATCSLAYGSVASVTITNGGAGYVNPPDVVFAVPAVQPTIGLRVSKDAGKTWGAEAIKSMGSVGEYRRRAIWRSVGRAKDRVFRFRISSPVKKVLLGYYATPS